MGHSPLPKLELTIAALAGRGEHKLKSVHVNVKKKRLEDEVEDDSEGIVLWMSTGQIFLIKYKMLPCPTEL